MGFAKQGQGQFRYTARRGVHQGRQNDAAAILRWLVSENTKNMLYFAFRQLGRDPDAVLGEVYGRPGVA